MATGNAGVESLNTLAKITRLGIYAVLVSLLPLICLYGLLFAAYMSNGFPSGMLFLLIAAANILFYVMLVLSGIALLFWIYRAHSNLHDAGLEELKHSPTWAVASWFVPLVNFVIPFTSMRALYNRSHGEEAIHADMAVGDIGTWWSCYIAASLILAFTTLTFAINALPGIWLTTPPAADTGLNLAAFFMMAGAAYCLLKIVNAVTQAQSHGASSASVFE